MSKQRELILKIMQSGCHLSASEVYDEARKEIPNISLGTVYRNLQSLVAENKLGIICTGDGAGIFDKKAIPHAHLICSCCGEISDIDSKELSDKLNDIFGTKITDYRLSAYYICDNCKEKQNAKA